MEIPPACYDLGRPEYKVPANRVKVKNCHERMLRPDEEDYYSFRQFLPECSYKRGRHGRIPLGIPADLLIPYPDDEPPVRI
jgi:hypothetical protein